jgi:catechol 2,3-dioxygenase-like lactoylglutathione lyase family enzyme
MFVMLTELNHLTLAVSDLERSFRFYTDVLNFTPKVRWRRGAYLTLGSLWLCLSLDQKITAREDYTHIAFSLAEQDFSAFRQRLVLERVELWKENQSEGDSIYFFDPDQHKLEAHVGNLQSRLSALKDQPYDDLEWF